MSFNYDEYKFKQFIQYEHIVGDRHYRLPKKEVKVLVDAGYGEYGENVPKTQNAMCDFVLNEQYLPLADIAKEFYELGKEIGYDRCQWEYT